MIPLLVARLSAIPIQEREGYEDNTISVTKNGVVDTISNSGSGTFESSTIIVTPNGVTDTTSDV